MKTNKERYQEALKLIGKAALEQKTARFLNRIIKNAQAEKIPTVPTFKEDLAEIVNHLNEVTGCSFKASTPETKKLVKSRLNAGFTVKDFKKVHIVKAKKWLHKPEWSPYLRPSTLYLPSKFEGYLQEYYIDHAQTKAQETKKQAAKEPVKRTIKPWNSFDSFADLHKYLNGLSAVSFIKYYLPDELKLLRKNYLTLIKAKKQDIAEKKYKQLKDKLTKKES